MIKNSGEVIVMVVYAGSETKLMQNLGEYNFKLSQMGMRVEYIMLFQLACMIIFILISAIWNFFKTKELFESHTYLTDNNDEDAQTSSLYAVVSFYLLYNGAIPLDIAVMLELNAIFYSCYIVWDARMTYLNE